MKTKLYLFKNYSPKLWRFFPSFLIVIFLMCATISSFSQTFIKGKVIDNNKAPVFAANVYFKNNINTGTVTNIDGNFILEINQDSFPQVMVFSFIGFLTKEILITPTDVQQDITILLQEENYELLGLEVIGKEPVSEQFSVTRLEPLDVYLNPLASADPLKAIASLGASTNTDESANVALRGSSADRSSVLLNGVPISDPVRNSQINGIGFFSLFNTEVMEKMYVYTGNPPLIYGNSSAGVVEVFTKEKVTKDAIQVSAGLASVGFFLTKKIKKNHHIRWYGNFQNSKAFIGLNQDKIPDLKRFQNLDMGINYFTNLNDKLSLKLFSYAINEQAESNVRSFSFEGLGTSEKKRNFNVINLAYQLKKGAISLNHGSNFSRSKFQFGNLGSDVKATQFYHALNFQQYINENWKFQTGFTFHFDHLHFKDQVPTYYFALSENSPSSNQDTTLSQHQLESYFYSSLNLSKQWIFSLGMRTNFPIKKNKHYLSYQLGIRFSPSRIHSFLLGAGQYHNYTIPSFYGNVFRLLQSKQVSLDYDLTKEDLAFKTAVFYKKETGKQLITNFLEIESNDIFGIEMGMKKFLGKHWNTSLANIFIDEKIQTTTTSFQGDNALKYFLKVGIQFDHPKYFNLGISLLARPGKFYTPINSAIERPELGFFQPLFSDEINSSQFGNYFRMDISLSKVFSFLNSSIILYGSVNNIGNRNNQLNSIYSFDYSQQSFSSYQKRIIYFGGVWNF